MNENINLRKILNNCPRGTKFYSSVLNVVTYEGMSGQYSEDGKERIFVSRNNLWYNFTPKGRLEPFFDGECVLFPSEEQRDWNKFTAAWYKQEKKETKRFDPNTLKEFDRVIVRKSYVLYWSCDLFSYNYIDFNRDNKSVCIGDNYCYCIPYNDDTKHLVGTTDEAPEFYRYWED